jgi:beta-phosphoglucomutase-like phosphatase (HAD superfamily)
VIGTLFDFNGVLVDDELVHLAAFADVLGPMGITLTRELYDERYLAYDDRGCFRAVLADHGRPHDADIVASLVEAKKPFYKARIATGLRIFPGATELVKRRATLGPIGIVSGALEDEIRFAIDAMGVAELVQFIVPAEHTKACKPDPEGYVIGVAHARERGAVGTIVAIEDATNGVKAAKAAGLRCVAVTHSYARGPLLEAGADAVVDTLDEATDAILQGS